MKKLLSITLLWALLLCACKSNQPLSVYDLRCEDLSEPLAIDSSSPHFSWKLSSQNDATLQTHYEVVVGTNPKAVKSGQGDLWSSGKVASDESVMVPYAGSELSSRTLAYWKVRVWDNHGNVSEWSDVQRFGVGILSAEEWQGDYIGLKDCTVPQLRSQFEVKDKRANHLLHVN